MKRISIGSWAYAIGPYEENPVPWDEVTSKLKALGFDGVELGGFSIHPSPETHPAKEDRDKLLADMEAVGLAFSGFVPKLWGENLIDTEDPTAYIDAFREGLQFASDLGIKGVRVDTVQPPTIFDEVDYDTALKRVSQTWRTCCDLAAQRGLYVTWEFEPGFAFNKPSDVVRVHDAVSRDNFGIMYDTCHGQMVAVVGVRQPGERETLPGGQLDLIKLLSGRINHIHLIDSDNTCHKNADGHDETSAHPPFGLGLLDFDSIVPALTAERLPHDWWTIDLCFWPNAWDATAKCKTAIDELNRKYG